MKSFFVIVFLVYSLINAYIFLRGFQAIPSGFIPRLTYSILFILIAFSFIVAMIGRNTLPLGLLKVMYAVGTTWLACMMYFLLFFLFTDIIGLLNKWLHFLPENITSHFRQIQVVLTSIVIVVMLIFGYYKFTHPSVNELDIKIDKKAGDKKKLRVVAISDIHLGLLIDKKRFSWYVNRINSLKPDVILIAGDIVDNSVRLLNIEHLEEELNRLQAPLGIYSCLGNHEYISGIDESLEFLNKTKIKLLKDSVVNVDNSFWIIGRDDRSVTKRKSLKNLVAEVGDKTQPIFLLDHQPYYLDDAKINGVDLQFSGHTHNGQLWPGNLFVKRMYEVGHGYKQKDNLHVYVSSGLTLWGPLFRIGTESEITVFNVKFK